MRRTKGSRSGRSQTNHPRTSRALDLDRSRETPRGSAPWAPWRTTDRWRTRSDESSPFSVFLSACLRFSTCRPVALPVRLLLSLLPPLSRCPILQEQVLIATKYSGEWPTYGTASLDSDVGAGHETTTATRTMATKTTTTTMMVIKKMKIGMSICTCLSVLIVHSYATFKITILYKGKDQIKQLIEFSNRVDISIGHITKKSVSLKKYII